MDKKLLEISDQKIFIDFGTGDNFDNVCRFSLKGYYTIIIDSLNYNNYNEAYIKNKQYVDKKIIGDWRNNYDVELADQWACVSCFEHIKPNDIDSSIKGIINKIKKNSVGIIYIDLTDHVKENLGFLHYKKDNFRSIKNTLKFNEWINIFSKYFTFDCKVSYLKDNKNYERSLLLTNIKLINNKMIINKSFVLVKTISYKEDAKTISSHSPHDNVSFFEEKQRDLNYLKRHKNDFNKISIPNFSFNVYENTISIHMEYIKGEQLNIYNKNNYKDIIYRDLVDNHKSFSPTSFNWTNFILCDDKIYYIDLEDFSYNTLEHRINKFNNEFK